MRRFLADLRSGRALLAAELTHPGWLDFGAFRWRDLAFSQAVRASLGVITPLIIGAALGRLNYGSYAALGALPAGFVSFRGISRTRVVAVVSAAVVMAVATFIAATAAHEPWLMVPVVLVWGYITGLLGALGPTVLAVTMQSAIALLIASAIPLRPADAAVRAGLVLAGGLWQCLLVISSWTVNRGSAERTALSASYSALARYADEVAAGIQEPPPPGQLAGSRALTDPNPLVQSAARQHLLDLAEEAERIRATLTAMSIGRETQQPGSGSRSTLGAAARVLSQIAAGLEDRPSQRAAHLAAAQRELDDVTAETGVIWQWASEALAGQLRSACRILDQLDAAEPAAGRDRDAAPHRGSPAAPSAAASARPGWRSDTLLTLRASAGASSEAGRHALRLAAVAALTQAIVSAAGLSHGYWAVLTVFIVLRPDYSSTLYRGLQRAAGTLVGAGLGVATVQLGRLGHPALLVGIGVCLVAAYALLTVNYVLYGVFLTAFIVVLLALLGLPPEPTAVARLTGTGVGAGLAILAYLLWPTWEGTSAAEKFARLMSTQGAYASALLRAYSRPGSARAGRIGQLQLAARRARINAEASADRLAGEPVRGPLSAGTARELESAGRRIAQACLALGAVVAAHQGSTARGSRPRDGAADTSGAALQPALDGLADGVDEAVARLAAALRADGTVVSAEAATPGPAGPWVASLPPLRALQQAIWRPRTGEPAAAPSGQLAGLAAATDSLVDAINTAGHVLERAGGPR